MHPDVKPSAKSSILMLGKEIVSKKFEADTGAEVMALVEDWARKHITHLKAHIERWPFFEVTEGQIREP